MAIEFKAENLGDGVKSGDVAATSLCVQAPSVIEVRLPAALLTGAELVVDGLAPGTDGSSSSHWGLLGTTTAKSSNGTYFVRIEGPLPRKIRYRLLIGGASVTCQGALIVGG